MSYSLVTFVTVSVSKTRLLPDELYSKLLKVKVVNYDWIVIIDRPQSLNMQENNVLQDIHVTGPRKYGGYGGN